MEERNRGKGHFSKKKKKKPHGNRRFAKVQVAGGPVLRNEGKGKKVVYSTSGGPEGIRPAKTKKRKKKKKEGEKIVNKKKTSWGGGQHRFLGNLKKKNT